MPYDKTADLAKYQAACASALREYTSAIRAGAQLNRLERINKRAITKGNRVAIKAITKLIAKFNAMPLQDREHPANQMRLIELEYQLGKLTNG